MTELGVGGRVLTDLSEEDKVKENMSDYGQCPKKIGEEESYGLDIDYQFGSEASSDDDTDDADVSGSM